MQLLRQWWAILLSLMLFSTISSRLALADQPSEYQLKGAYLYHFTKFVTWPDNAFTTEQAPFQICILGENPFGQLLDALTQKTIHNKPITIVELPTKQSIHHCHLLFIAQSEQDQLTDILAITQNKPILTVGDMPHFTQQGGMIQFMRVNDTLRFSINQKIALQSDLKISATMLQVGYVIQ